MTERGAQIASESLERFRESIEQMFAGLSKEDESELTAALKTMNNILSKMEQK